MWVIKKEYSNRTEYVSEVNTSESRSFKLSEELCLFETEDKAIKVLKASGYNGISGIKVEEYVEPITEVFEDELTSDIMCPICETAIMTCLCYDEEDDDVDEAFYDDIEVDIYEEDDEECVW